LKERAKGLSARSQARALAAIRGSAELLEDGAVEDAAARARFLGNIQLEASRLNQIVDDLLRLSRIETAPGPAAARVSVGRRQFSIGRPVEFDDASPHVAALEYALGAVGGEVVNGLREFARRRGVPFLTTGKVIRRLLRQRA
jgi:signal transduction histidine kinase